MRSCKYRLEREKKKKKVNWLSVSAFATYL